MPRKRILMVAMPSLHFYRWVQQLEDSEFEVFWFDITGSGTFIERISWIHQITKWKLRWDFPGRTFVKSKSLKLYDIIKKINERPVFAEFEKVVKTIKPDIVHSFALYIACTPILQVMKKYDELKWIYSSWGSDLFYFQNKAEYLVDIKNVLKRVDYLITDCNRDRIIAEKYGFKGRFLGVFPGGGGFDLEELDSYKKNPKDRNTIIIKGYQGRSGRAIPVLRAILKLKKEVAGFNIVVFGADPEVLEYVNQSDLKNWDNFKVFGKISHTEVLELMGESRLYIGNSNSDGMPNTLLEAICMDVYPIQSNPGSASEEIIEHHNNGLLIENHDDYNEIALLIKASLKNSINSDNRHIKEAMSYKNVRKLCLQEYLKVYND